MDYSDIGKDAFDLFETKLAETLWTDLMFAEPDATLIASKVANTLTGPDEKTVKFKQANAYLEGAQIQRLWNQVFRRYRSQYMAEWLLPYCQGRVLDLLCGDGDISKHLNERGLDVALVERNDGSFYTHSNWEAMPFVDYSTFSDRDGVSCDTVLLVAVLHHELDPMQLLKQAVQSASKRIVIIENCINEAFSAEYQQLVDIFFNEVLNTTDSPSPAHHRRPQEWIDIAQKFGRVTKHEFRNDIPGIPLTHDLIVCEVGA